VTITWGRALDDGAAERDVERYAVYRRLQAVAEFTEPVASIPAGSSSYSWVDTDVIPGQQWIYGIAAQDCTPTSSPVAAIATPVTIPAVIP
jgi:hypothetical protein